VYNFRQIIHAESEDDNKLRILDFIGKLIIREKEPYEVIVRPYKKSKTVEQLGYYWGVIIPMFCAEFGHHKDDADQFLKEELLEPKVMGFVAK